METYLRWTVEPFVWNHECLVFKSNTYLNSLKLWSKSKKSIIYPGQNKFHVAHSPDEWFWVQDKTSGNVETGYIFSWFLACTPMISRMTRDFCALSTQIYDFLGPKYMYLTVCYSREHKKQSTFTGPKIWKVLSFSLILNIHFFLPSFIFYWAY